MSVGDTKPPPPPPPDSAWCTVAQNEALTWSAMSGGLGRFLTPAGAPAHLHYSAAAGGPVLMFTTATFADRRPLLLTSDTADIALAGTPVAGSPEVVLEDGTRWLFDVVASNGSVPILEAVRVG